MSRGGAPDRDGGGGGGGTPGETLPPGARERLGRGLPGVRPLFVTGLSPGGLLALRGAGAEPLGQVMGCSVYAVTAPTFSAVSGELKFLTGALREMQRLALDRLRAEAALLGADGVVGVSFRFRHQGTPAAPLRELRVTGTAVREPAPGRGGAGGAPWLSGLSGTEYAQLRQAGYRPVSLALGNCAYFRLPASLSLGGAQQAAAYYGLPLPRPGATNAGPGAAADVLLANSAYERKEFSEAVYAARRLATERMEAEARACGAGGIVGVRVEVERRADGGESPGLFVHFFAAGTAVEAAAGVPLPPAAATGLAVPLGG